MDTWKDVKVGDRILMRMFGWTFEVTEARVLEFSPSKKYVKVRFSPGKTEEWIEKNRYMVLEILE